MSKKPEHFSPTFSHVPVQQHYFFQVWDLQN